VPKGSTLLWNPVCGGAGHPGARFCVFGRGGVVAQYRSILRQDQDVCLWLEHLCRREGDAKKMIGFLAVNAYSRGFSPPVQVGCGEC